MALLGMSLAIALSIVSTARSRVIRAEQDWARQHNLEQVTEFYLTAGSDAPIPDWLLPRGFRATCTLEPVQDLPAYADRTIDKFILARYHIRVIGLRNEIVAENTIEKLIPENAVE